MTRDTRFLIAAILCFLVMIFILSFLYFADASAAPQSNAESEAQILNRLYDSTTGTLQAIGLSRGTLSPQANNLSPQQIWNYIYDPDCGCIQFSIDDSSADIPFISTTNLTAGDLLYYDTTGEEWLNTQGEMSVIGIATSPALRLKNPTQEDTNGGRESTIIAKGLQSGGEESTLAEIEISHDGTGDDQKGRVAISVNDGNDGDTLTEVLEIIKDASTSSFDWTGNTYWKVGGNSIFYTSPTIFELYIDQNLWQTSPQITSRNTTQEDISGGRETFLVFEGEQSGGEASQLAKIEASHLGTADDEKGRFIIYVNDGDDGTTPTEALNVTGDFIIQKIGQGIKRTDAGAADYNPSALTKDYLITADNSGAARAVTLSTEDVASGTAANPRIFLIKDEYGASTTYNITITLEGGGTIDGAASQTLNSNYAALMLYCTGTNCFLY